MPATLLPEPSFITLPPRILTITRDRREESAVDHARAAAYGRALRMLSHAVEYLQNSHITATADPTSDTQAVHILLRLSRAVFRDYMGAPDPPASAAYIPAEQVVAA